MNYIVSPKYKKSVRYKTTYKHSTRDNIFAIHDEYFRFESFLVEFRAGIDIEKVKDWDVLDLDEDTVVDSYESQEDGTDVGYAEWNFSGLTDEEREELEQYIEEEYGLYDHEDWEEVELEISIEGGVNIEPAK
ncbi:hypothetical protein [Yoonia vestfoldensis]|uniref:Uncharacterized protein n=1 Tax=Yoonia vestfoldensis TaxID=245188 RepID=A0A1Y0EH27_9RHOB|nr:hypothetical protein [Yoonia vestfoldensis]ARU02691.1 hypothetical protein LOKVESSMR4R_03419 [Yoonia vestfoldensis]